MRNKLPSIPRAKVPLLALLLGLAVTAVLAGACGGGSTKAADASPSSPSASASSSTSAGAAPGSGAAQSPGARSSAAGGGNSSASRASFTQCLEQNGVPASEAQGTGLFGRRSGTSGSGTSGSGSAADANATPPTMLAQLQIAFQKCRSLLPASGRFGGSGANVDTTQFTAYRNCLQEHGVKIPTPKAVTGQTSGSTSAGESAGGLANLRNNPTDKAAAQACADLLPQPGGSSSTSAKTAG